MAKSLAVRVDDRLIHGQVVTQWVKVFKAQKIVVIDNNVAKDKMQKNVLKFAAPPEIKVSIFSVDKAVEIWEKNQFGNLNVFVLFKDVSDGEDTGFTEEEAQTLFDLEKDGVKLYFQTQPTDKKESLDMVKKTFPNVQ